MCVCIQNRQNFTMAMVISGRAKGVIAALVCFILLGAVLVTGSTKGWFVPQNYHGERVAARIQVNKICIQHYTYTTYREANQYFK